MRDPEAGNSGVIARLDRAMQMLRGEPAARVSSLGRRDHISGILMSQPFDASRSLAAFEQDSTLVAVIGISQSKWLVAAVVPGVEPVR
jgi:hypothetical protein